MLSGAGRRPRLPIDADRRHPDSAHRGDGHQRIHHVAIGQADARRHSERPMDQRRKSAGAAWPPAAVSSVPLSTRSTTAHPGARLLDEVAGDGGGQRLSRQIIAAMAKTAKPYFGDVADAGYLRGATSSSPSGRQLDRRYRSVGNPWLADTLAGPLRADAAACRSPVYTTVDQTLLCDAGLLDNPQQAIAALLARARRPRPCGYIPRMCAFRDVVQTLGGQAGQLRAGDRPGRAALVARRLM